jgi:quinol-cytochrome oxidoreductase complex cytochrome b subunit
MQVKTMGFWSPISHSGLMVFFFFFFFFFFFVASVKPETPETNNAGIHKSPQWSFFFYTRQRPFNILMPLHRSQAFVIKLGHSGNVERGKTSKHVFGTSFSP